MSDNKEIKRTIEKIYHDSIEEPPLSLLQFEELLDPIVEIIQRETERASKWEKLFESRTEQCKELSAKAQEWISVNTPPKKDGKYLFWDKRSNWVDTCYFEHGNWGYDRVDMWQPLPDPPENRLPKTVKEITDEINKPG